MDKASLERLIALRQQLIQTFERVRDYKNNPNAIMKEIEHAQFIHKTITNLDAILQEHVTFSEQN